MHAERLLGSHRSASACGRPFRWFRVLWVIAASFEFGSCGPSLDQLAEGAAHLKWFDTGRTQAPPAPCSRLNVTMLFQRNKTATCDRGVHFGFRDRAGAPFLWLARGAQCQGVYQCCGAYVQCTKSPLLCRVMGSDDDSDDDGSKWESKWEDKQARRPHSNSPIDA